MAVEPSSSRKKIYRELEMFVKGTQVEVCDEEEGCKRAWYVATIINLPSPSSKTSEFPKGIALVEYKTLHCRDGKPLTEIVDVSSIRPLPPAETTTKLPSFDIFDVVDANYLEGWWIGVVTEVRDSVDEKNRMLKLYTVVFESHPEKMDFEAKRLRFHLDWVNDSWVRPKQRKKMEGLNFSRRMAVEVNLDEENPNDDWYPATVLHRIGYNSFLVEYNSSSSKDKRSSVRVTTVDSFHMRHPPPKLVVKKFELFDKVNAFCESAWRLGVVTNILRENMYVVCLNHAKNGNQEKEFSFSELRPHMTVKNGKWATASKDRRINASGQELVRHAKNLTDNVPTLSPLSKKFRREISTDPLSSQASNGNLMLNKKPNQKAEASTRTLTQCSNYHVVVDEPSTGNESLFSAKHADKLHVAYSQEQQRNARNDAKKPDAANQLECSSAAKGNIKERDSHTDSANNPIQQLTAHSAIYSYIKGLQTEHKKVKQNKETNLKENRVEGELMISMEEPELQPNLEVKSQPLLTTSIAMQTTGQDELMVSLEKLGMPENSQVEGQLIQKAGPLIPSTMITSSDYLEKEAVAPAAETTCNPFNDSQASLTSEGNSFAMVEKNQVLPFVKESPAWKMIESLEIFQRMPQNPHFRPLAEWKELEREGAAFGKMAYFAMLVQKTSKLKLDAPRVEFDSYLEALTDLAKHGFDVKAVVDRLNNLLSIKDRKIQHKNQSKAIQGQIADHTPKRNKAQEDVDDSDTKIRELLSNECILADKVQKLKEQLREFERKLLEVKEQVVQAKGRRALEMSVKEKMDLEMTELEGKYNDVMADMGNDDLDFQTVASAPW